MGSDHDGQEKGQKRIGIYIKGMEMPKEYGRCMVIFPDGRVTTEFGSQVIATAVPVPPHGRLIDADKLKESIRKQTGFLKLMGGEMAEIAETLEKGFLQEIANAPTIIPAEEET